MNYDIFYSLPGLTSMISPSLLMRTFNFLVFNGLNLAHKLNSDFLKNELIKKDQISKIEFIVKDVNLVDGKPELTIDILRGGFTTPTRAYLSTTYAHQSLFSEGSEMTIDREMKALLYHELLKRDDLMFKINHPNSKPQETEIVNSME